MKSIFVRMKIKMLPKKSWILVSTGHLLKEKLLIMNLRKKTMEEAMDLGVEMTQIVDDFNEDAVPQAP